jgi:subtilisin family serine protease
MPVRVLDRHGTGNLWVLAEALAYAVDPDGDPLTDDGAHVINLSISTLRRTNLLADLLQTGLTADDDGDDADDEPDEDLRRAGYYNVVVVAAAGNSGTSRMEYPAAELVPGVLSVAASTAADTIAPFSSNGSWIGVAAPGASILSSVPGGGYGTWSGTSMAAPLAAGTVALVRSHEPGLNAEEVVGRLQETAVKLEAPVQSRIDAAAALNAQTQQTDESE